MNLKENNYKKTGNLEKNLEEKKILLRKSRIILGIVLQTVFYFTFISLVSHFFWQKNDQAFLESLKELSFYEAGSDIKNWFGICGAFVGYLLVYKFFGISAFIIILPLYFFSYSLTNNKQICNVSTTRLLALSLSFSFCIGLLYGYLLISFDPQGMSSFALFVGGLGYAAAKWSKSIFGLGTLLIIAGMFAILAVYAFNLEKLYAIRKFWSEIGKKFSLKKLLKKTKKQNSFGAKNFEENDVQDFSESIDGVGQVDENADGSAAGSNLDIKQEKNFGKGERVVEVHIKSAETLEYQDGGEKTKNQEVKNHLPLPKNDEELVNYIFPTTELLEEYPQDSNAVTKAEIEQNKNKIVETLTNFNIGVSTIYATIGPTVTLYEIIPDAGIKISRIKNLEDDIALSLAALGIRIIAPIPGKGTIGIEVPNKTKQIVPLRAILESRKFTNSSMTLPLVIGKGIDNEPCIVDLAVMPHLLIAGATGQGKSVGINVVLASLIYKKHPSQLKLVLVDPKKVELSLYANLEKHFLAKLPGTEDSIITETKKVVNTLNSLCKEMDNRYDLLKEAGVRNIREYNIKFNKGLVDMQQGHRFLPYIVLVIDEFADLMMVAGKEVELPIARLAQLARAIGIHLILATQRPSVNIITGIIKANFPARLSFKVSSKVDSRTILDASGSEQLVGRGDLLLSINSNIERLQCPFLDTEEVERICTFIGDQPGYQTPYYLPEALSGDDGEFSEDDIDISQDRDPLFFDAARLIVSAQQGSTSLIQRKMKLGYNRAGRLIDQLEAAGIVGPADGSKAREVFVFDMSHIDIMQKNS